MTRKRRRNIESGNISLAGESNEESGRGAAAYRKRNQASAMVKRRQ